MGPMRGQVSFSGDIGRSIDEGVPKMTTMKIVNLIET